MNGRDDVSGILDANHDNDFSALDIVRVKKWLANITE